MSGAGGGSIIHMINTYKENRALLKRIKPFQKHKDSGLYKYGIKEVRYKTISETDLLVLRKKLRRTRRINDIIMAFSFIICLALGAGLYYLIVS